VLSQRWALVRRPNSRLAEGIVTHIERAPVDPHLAGAQWARYVEVLASRGWETLELAAADRSPDSVFVEDTMVLHADLAVIARPAIGSRRPELRTAELAIAGLGYRLARISAPATLDGGDVLRVGRTVYVGLGGRTNGAAATQLRSLLAPFGARVVGVPIAGVLHLKTALATLPDGSIVGHPPLLVDPEAFPALRSVPEPTGAQVLVIDERTLLLSDDCPRSAELYARLGYEPVTVDIGEFQKLEGAVTCLSVLAVQSLT
jgi:dimethylargininase